MDDEYDDDEQPLCSSRTENFFRFLAYVLLIFNVDYLLAHFQVAQVRDFVSLAAIFLLFRVYAIEYRDDRFLLQKYILAMFSFNFWGFIPVLLRSQAKPGNVAAVKFVQFAFVIVFWPAIRPCFWAILLIVSLAISKFLQAYAAVADHDWEPYQIIENEIIVYSEEVETLAVLLLSVYIGDGGLFNLLEGDHEPRLRNSGILGLLQHKMRITNSFQYFAFYSLIAPIWNLLFKNVVYDSLVQVFGMVCFVWFLVSELVHRYRHDMPLSTGDKYFQKARKLNFLDWFLAILFFKRSWRLSNFQEQVESIYTSILVIVIYYLTYLRIRVRMYFSARREFYLVTGECGRFYRNNFVWIAVYSIILVFPVVCVWGCWYFRAFRVDVGLLFVLSVELTISLLDDWLPCYTKPCQRTVKTVVNYTIILMLLVHIFYNIVENGWLACLEVETLMWINQIYVHVRSIYEHYYHPSHLRI